jgi:hypothetical protein
MLKIVNGWDAFITFKIYKISHVFDENFSPEVNWHSQSDAISQGKVQ